MPEAYGAFVIFLIVCIISLVVFEMVPERLQDRLWEFLRLDNDEPYSDNDEYDRYLSDRECACSLCQEYDPD